MSVLNEVDHSLECAQFIFDNGVNHMDYGYHLEAGKDPRQHILWSAAHVLNLIEAEGFQEEYQAWDEKQTAKMRVRGTW